MKDKEEPRWGDKAVSPRGRRTLQRITKVLIIGCSLAYLIWTCRPGQLRSFKNPYLTEYEKWLQEIADLMGELYVLLTKMGYLKAGAIAYAPHYFHPINITLTSLMGLSAEATLLLQILPYITSTPGPLTDFLGAPIPSATNWRALRFEEEFLLSTRLADMRDDKILRKCRDPWFGDEFNPEREYGINPDSHILKPWELALTGIDKINYWASNDTNVPMGGTMVLDLRSRQLYTIGWGAVPTTYYSDTSIESRGSLDPATRGMLAPDANPKGRNGRTKVETYASRPAIEVLRDYISRFKTLEWVPGFVEGDSITAYPRTAYKSLYTTHGWPLNFNLLSFSASRLQWDKEARAQYEAAQPIRDLLIAQNTVNRSKEFIKYWKADLVKLEEIEKELAKEEEDGGRKGGKKKGIAEIGGYNVKSKKYNGRTKKETLDAIDVVGKRLVEEEKALVEAVEMEKGVSEEVKKKRTEIIELYGGEYELEYQFAHVKYE